MRVIAGSARGRRLVAPRGLSVRPTPERLREALFSALAARVAEASVWDACAGSGAIGIEALSRGASQAVFSEKAMPARTALLRNLEAAGLGDRARVIPAPWQRAARVLAAEGACFDLVYYDPPYDAAEPERFLAAATPLLAEDGLVLIEHRRGSSPGGGTLRLARTMVAGSSAIAFFGRG